MLGLAWLGRDSSQHAGAAQIDPAPEVSKGPPGPWISYQAIAGPGAPLRGPLRSGLAATNSHRLVTGDGEAVRFGNLCPNAFP